VLFSLMDLYGTDKTDASLSYNVLHFAQSSDWILALTLRVGKGKGRERSACGRVGVWACRRIGGSAQVDAMVLSGCRICGNLTYE
jgi:hypothetical protein